jgi:uncharacterized oxidoreductase
MKLSGNTILITGGASGIGFALARRFVEAGSEVIACGRRADQLEKARSLCPGLKTVVADVSTAQGRTELFDRVVREFPSLNILINNAGIQNRPPPLAQPQSWQSSVQEIAINFEAPIHLSMLFLPHLLKQSNPAIMNVTSGLAFAPISFMPVYCATKAALHSFTLSLRHQLAKTQVRVIEIAPPAVNTDLGGVGLHTTGADLDLFADHCMKHLAAGDLEFGYESSETRRAAMKAVVDPFFNAMNR